MNMKSETRNPNLEVSRAGTGQAKTQQLRKMLFEFLSFGFASLRMRAAGFILLALLCSIACLPAQVTNRFPAHWGPPPRIETRDYRKLPGDYGFGSSTLARWIQEHLDKDHAGAPAPPAAKPLYENNFERAVAGKLPEGFSVSGDDFTVQSASSNRFLSLAGSTPHSCTAMFGPVVGADTAISARILGTAKDSRFPKFGVGLGGTNGWKLMAAPDKSALQLWRDGEVKATMPFTWRSGTWTTLRLQVRRVVDGAWTVEGKAWEASSAEPKAWTVRCETSESPPTGWASVIGTPLARTPIRFDDLVVTVAK